MKSIRSQLLLTASIGVASAVVALAADFWQQKPPDQWSEKDCSKLVAKSPWAKDTPVAMGAMGQGMGPQEGGRGSRGSGGGSPMGTSAGGGGNNTGSGGGGGMGSGGGMGGGGGRGPGGGDMGAQMPDLPHVLVRWDSAQPVIEAMKKVSVSRAVEDADIQAFYIVTVDGLSLRGRRQSGTDVNGGQDRPHSMTSEQQERLKAATNLAAKGKEPVQPGKIDVIPGDDGKMTVRFYFPRSAEFSLDDKELNFYTRVGPMEVKQKFVLKDMTFGGKLAL
jgi:hypothetical protein